MLTLYKNPDGRWSVKPVIDPVYTALGLGIIFLMGLPFFFFAGMKTVLPFVMSFIACPLLAVLFYETRLSKSWFCFIHCLYIQKFIDLFHRSVRVHTKGFDLLWMIFLFGILTAAGLILWFMVHLDDYAPVFFLIMLTNALCYLNCWNTVPHLQEIVVYSFYVQIVITAMSQTLHILVE